MFVFVIVAVTVTNSIVYIELQTTVNQQTAFNQQLRREAALNVKHQETTRAVMAREMAAQLAKVSKSIVLYCVVWSCTRPL